MSTVNKFITLSLALIALYLVLSRATGASRILGSIGVALERVFRTLQGRASRARSRRAA